MPGVFKGALKIKKNYIWALLFLLVFVLGINSYAESSFEKYRIDLPISDHILADSMESYRGIWECHHIVYKGVTYSEDFILDVGGMSDISLDIVGNNLIEVFNDKVHYVYDGIFENGVISFRESGGSQRYELFLTEDGYMSFSIFEGLEVILERSIPEYEEIDYEKLMRNQDKYKSQLVQVKGKVIQITDKRSEGYYQIRVSVGEDNNIILCEFIDSPAFDLTEGDTVSLKLRFMGEYTYDAALGIPIDPVPAAVVHEIELSE